MNEKGVPSFGQKPSVRPGRPSRLRPTGSLQWAQNRLSSGICGSASTIDAGSGTVAAGIVTRPAPSLPAAMEVLVVPVGRVPVGAEGALAKDGALAADGVLAGTVADAATAGAVAGAFVPQTLHQPSSS